MEHHDRKARRAKLTLAGIGVLIASALVAGGITAFSLLGDDDSKSSKATASPSVSAPSASSSAPGSSGPMTPDKGRKITLKAPTGQKDGISTGFPNTPNGQISAAVYFWEEYAWLDDQKARQQLQAIVSKDAPGYIDEQISDVRKFREALNLPPSGGVPAGITFTTAVKAVRMRSLSDDGKVVEIWMTYDRFATKPDGGPDDNPLKDQADMLILKWQDGMWKLTNEPRYWSKRDSPKASYFPDSPYASKDGWVQVRHAD
ncbi:hypothetical protein ABT071_21445 [Streptomyces sp. NPDC002506]|uniref:hypothetical protein n=1 Tax=unclassified Streptomyces TaxID=2593676 RepID=UPI001F2D0E5C|nr:hypothetical protein [Streptomyces sp. CB01201]